VTCALVMLFGSTTRRRTVSSGLCSIKRNPAANALASSLDRHFGDGASRAKRHEDSLADRARLAALLATAGFAHPRLETITRQVRFASIDEWVRIQFAATPLATLLGGASRRSVNDWSRAWPFLQEVHIAVTMANRSE
jgi:hypothetical protein